ncbi:MAG: beta-galactosidase [Clostridia bacterium]|nr:beta-galactosidase [Clostridia bacterium]
MKSEVVNGEFYIDGRKTKLLSGAVHYFRNMPDTWDDIFAKMRALGLNCVETYCAWNMHEKKKGQFCFKGMLDVSAFIRKAGEAGLYVIVRPGPYICAEWEFGGLPWWLQNEEDMEIRSSNSAYTKCYESYLKRLFEEIKPLLCTNGGPVIMLQCENEYGYYGNDKEYLKHLYVFYRENGIDVPLFTSDGVSQENLMDGTTEGCFPTLNFGSRVSEKFKAHDKLFPNDPKMCMELWDGWFDAWGDEFHHTASAESYAETVRDMIKKGSLNIYMFIGGTNFGFTNGANHDSSYAPVVTSYDYDALLTECGDITPKYLAVREVIKETLGTPLPEIPEDREKRAYGKVLFKEYAPLLQNLNNISKSHFSVTPKNMEKYGEGYGYIAYCTELKRDYKDSLVSFESIGDRAHVFVNQKLCGTLYINDKNKEVKFSAKSGDVLTVLCENMGRADFGSKMARKKGIIGRCLIDGKLYFGWKVYPLPMEDLENLEFYNGCSEKTALFLKGSFDADKPCDTFLRLDNFRKGFVMINGFNIGRYWEIGPQKTLYVPASILKEGQNEIIVFESDGLNGTAEAEFVAVPDLGQTEIKKKECFLLRFFKSFHIKRRK